MTQKYNFLLPAYKPDFFKEALDSILGQTYRDFKLIILDDCSPYDLKSIVDEYDDDRITYHRNEENMGGKSLVACWNKLLGFADSEYIILASDDDVYELNFLEEMDKLAKKYPGVDLLRARVRAINDNNETIDKDALYEEFVDGLDFLKQKHFNNALRCIANYVFKSSVLKENEGFIDFPLAWYSDDATVMMMAENGAANSHDMLFNFRSSSISISSRKLSKTDAYKKALATLLFDKWFQEHIAQRMESYSKNEYVDKVIRFVTHHHNSFMYQMFSYFSSNCTMGDFRKLLRLLPTRKTRFRRFYNYLRAKMK